MIFAFLRKQRCRLADMCICFSYMGINTIPLLSKPEISSLYPNYEAVHHGMCQTLSETPKTGFSQSGEIDADMASSLFNLFILIESISFSLVHLFNKKSVHYATCNTQRFSKVVKMIIFI